MNNIEFIDKIEEYIQSASIIVVQGMDDNKKNEYIRNFIDVVIAQYLARNKKPAILLDFDQLKC